MNALFMIVAAILLLGPLIAIHEFGHYWVARKLGVKVLVYSIGFGPTLLKWQSKKSGIQYQLSALPLGGYVKMLDEREGNVAEQDLPYAFNRQSPWKRIAIVAAGPLINLIFAIFLFWILYNLQSIIDNLWNFCKSNFIIQKCSHCYFIRCI